MPLTSFNLVLTGDNFPVSSIKVSDFTFRHRNLKEILRIPVALQAENDVVSLQVLADRFQVAVMTPDHVPTQAAGIQEMANTFLEYVGRRTLTAVGHNIQWVLSGSEARKAAFVDSLTRKETLSSVLGSDDYGADLTLLFTRGTESQARMLVQTSSPGDVTLDFNFHFDLSDGGSVADALNALEDSLQHVEDLSRSMESLFLGVEA